MVYNIYKLYIAVHFSPPRRGQRRDLEDPNSCRRDAVLWLGRFGGHPLPGGASGVRPCGHSPGDLVRCDRNAAR